MKNGLKWLFVIFGKEKAKDACIAWQDTFNLEDNRSKMVLKDLANYCNFTSSSFTAGDSHQTAFNEGARDVFLHILEMADLDLNTVLHFLERDNFK